jgi:hypothetical protein
VASSREDERTVTRDGYCQRVRRTSRWRWLAGGAVLLLLTGAAAGASSLAHYRHYHGDALNDLRATPGATFAVGLARICQSGYSSSVRDVSESEKAQVYLEYGITHRVYGQYEVDHLISLELGGSNAPSNLWPEPNDHPRGYLNSKDILENRLHDLVCAHALPLARVQHAIATNWVLEFRQVMGYWPSGAGVTTPTAPVGATGGVSVTHAPSSVAPRGTATLSVHSATAHDACTLTVTLPSGRQSTVSGLGTQSADASGNVTWVWTVTWNTGAGTATYRVACGAGSTSGTFTIT